jgi:hypothetical protein
VRETGQPLKVTESVLAGVSTRYVNMISSKQKGEKEKNIRDVQEAIFILVLFVDAAHKCSCWRKNLIHEDEDGLLGRKLYALADHIDELSHGEVGRH